MPRIRKQYHFRPSPNGYYAWDIQKLASKTANYKPQQVPLCEIREIDEAYWFGTPGDMATCRHIAEHARLIQDADLDHPIIMCSNRRVMDGMHRVLKALNLGLGTIDAVIFDNDPEPDFADVYPDDLPT